MYSRAIIASRSSITVGSARAVLRMRIGSRASRRRAALVRNVEIEGAAHAVTIQKAAEINALLVEHIARADSVQAGNADAA
jgi:hypothetical protein